MYINIFGRKCVNTTTGLERFDSFLRKLLSEVGFFIFCSIISSERDIHKTKGGKSGLSARQKNGRYFTGDDAARQ